SSVTPKSSGATGEASPCSELPGGDCNYGTLTDTRDGQTYKTVTIGDQVWMAENLNYAYTGVPYNYSGYTSDSTSWCYENDPANCAKYGRLYTWAAAMDSSGTWSTNGKGCGYGSECSPTGTIRGICPEGWHLPDTTEWNTLFTAVGGSFTAGTALKSTSGWNEDEGESGNGTDSFGFSALPAGYRYNGGDYDNEGYDAYFWSSTEYNSNYAYYMLLYYNYDYAALYDGNKNYGFSVRCLKD
ncbi:fibrobacter succinogenes major paralogous domain-containing protein, partial [Fibrobacter sp. UBA3806]